MDPNLIAQLLANDPNTTTATQSNNPAPQTIPANNPPQPQNTTALQSPPQASSSPTPSTTNDQLAPPRRNRYTDAFNPYQTPGGPRYYPDSDFDSDSEDDSGHSFLDTSINSGKVYGPINNGIIYGNGFGMSGWPNGNIVINRRDWVGTPQAQWPASVRRIYQRGMAEGPRAMGEAAGLLNSLGLGMGMGTGGRRRR